jgi:hypothetical protein
MKALKDHNHIVISLLEHGTVFVSLSGSEIVESYFVEEG